jgi:hypothetical protein
MQLTLPVLRALPFGLLTAFLAGCGAGATAAPDSFDAGALPECEAYQQELARCTGRPSDVLRSARAAIKDDADRASVRALCAQNLQHLRSTCR